MDSAAPRIDSALDEIGASILPSLALLLDTLLETAGAARPGVDANSYAAEIRMLSLGVEELTRQVEAVDPIPARAAQEPARLRISA